MDTERKVSAAYLPWATFITALDHLAAIRIPNKIERSTFGSLSYQAQVQLISAFRFLDLIDDNGVPQPMLHELVPKKDERSTIMKQIIEQQYADIVALDFAKLTTSQLDSALGAEKYGVSGETKKKAKAFLLKAALFSGFTVHTLLTKITRNRNKGTAKKAAAKAGKSESGSANGDTTSAGKKDKGAQPPPPPPDLEVIRMPVALGPGRIAHIELPKDWQPRELKKLIALLTLSLGDDSTASSTE